MPSGHVEERESRNVVSYDDELRHVALSEL